MEQTEVRHKDNFETVDLLFYARTISGVTVVLEYGEKQESVNYVVRCKTAATTMKSTEVQTLGAL